MNTRMSAPFLLTFLTAASAIAQTFAGSMAGVVFDPSGAVVPGAAVRLIGTETGDVAREFVTGEDGAFTAPLMRPSTYTVEVSASGFKKFK